MFRLFVIAGAVLLAQACTVVVDGGEEQCSVDADCADRGFQNATCQQNVCVGGGEGGGGGLDDPVWGCLGNVPDPDPDPENTVSFDIRLAFAVSGAAVPTDTVVDACDKLDPTCSNMTVGLPKGLNPDPAGVVEFEVPEGFDGFVQVISPSDAVVPSRIYVGRPLFAAPSVQEIQFFSQLDFELLAGLAMEDVDPMRGTAIVLVEDCSGVAAGGVSFESPNADSETLAFYLINQSPTPVPTATETDSDGFGGFFNLAPASALVRAFRADDDAFVGESSFQVLEGVISYVLVAPTPE